jgi:hypothetical protein
MQSKGQKGERKEARENSMDGFGEIAGNPLTSRKAVETTAHGVVDSKHKQQTQE